MLLAGDLGATKTLLGLFEEGDRRPQAVAVRAYPTQSFGSFTDILNSFARDAGCAFAVHGAAVGVAGAVLNQKAHLTNVVWDVTAAEITSRFETPRVRLLNDVEATAISVSALVEEELEVLQRGTHSSDGNAAVIAAGTGLGEAYLYRVNGRFRPVPSEAGHADFAARTDAEIDFLRMLRRRHGRAQVEDVVSGPGLVNLYRFTHSEDECTVGQGLQPHDMPAAISEAALRGTCARCMMALSMFVDAYGAEAGNLALRSVATGGVYIGGGIAPKILPALRDGRFLAAFGAKPPMADLLAKMPVQVILNPEAGLLGAAVAAQELVNSA